MSNARDIADAGHQLIAWVRTDRTDSANQYIAGAYNVTSITDLASAIFKINFALDIGFNASTSAVVDSIHRSDSIGGTYDFVDQSGSTGAYCFIRTRNGGNTNVDTDFSIAVFDN